MNHQECKSSFLTPEHFSGAVSEINCANEDVSNYFKSSLSSISNSSAVIEDMQCKNNFNYFEKDKVKPSQSNLLTVCQNDLVDDLHKPHFKNSRFLPISPCQNSGIFLEEALNVCVDSDESKVQLLTPKNFKEYPVFSNGQFPKCDETYHSKLNSNVLQKQNISSFMSKSEPKSSHHYKSPIAMPQSTRAVPSNLMYEPTKIDIDVVKRKLNFENDIKFTEEEKGTKEFPEFSCNFNVDEKIIEKLTLSDQNSHVQPSLSFQKNPFPPIGVFWDIENCRIPKGSSGTHVVQAIRNRFFDGFKEAEFVCVCDTLKEQPQVLEELNDTQINIIHVGSTVKNAADDKLLQCMRRFADIHGPGSTIVVITGDSDFAVELYDLRYRKKLHVILVHNAHAQDSLKLSAHETALFSDVTQVIPQSSSVLKPKKPRVQNADVYIWNLPSYIDSSLIKRRLQALSANCGAKSFTVHKNYAKIRYHTLEAAIRGRKRIEGTDVFGNRVNCTFERCCEVPAEQNLEYLPLFNGYSDSRSEKYPGFGFNGLRSNYQMDTTPSFRMYNGYNQRYQHPVPVGETGNNSWKNWRSSYGPRNTNGPYSGHAMDSYPMNYNNGSNRCSSYFSKRRERSSESPYSSEEAGCETYPEYVNSPSQSPVNEFDPYENATSTGSETTSQSVVDMKDGIERVALVDRTAMKAFWEKCRSILWEEADCSLALDELMNKFSEMFDQTIGLEEIERDLSGYLEILHCDSGVRVQLNPLQKFIRSAVVLLGESGGRMLLSNFESVFQDRFGVSCNSAAHGFSSVQVLLLSVDSLFSIMGKKPKQYVVLNKEAMNKLPKYSPPIPTRIPNSVREKPKWNNFSCSNVHPSSLQNGPVPQSQSIEAPPPPPPTPPCGQNKLWGKDYSGSHLVMGVTPPQQSFHQPPVIYSGSPTPPNGTIVWGQVWSPPYSVISPVSPAPYMMPSVPLNWTSVPNVHPSSAPQVENADPANEKYPVSLYSLEQGTGREATPPSANELPSPDFLKSAESKFEIPESSSEAVPPHPDEQRGVKGCGRRLAMHFNADM